MVRKDKPLSRIYFNYILESKTTSPEIKIWDLFWILGRVLDTRKCFWILERIFGLWDVLCPYKLPYKIVKAYLSELAGLLVTGLKMYTSSKIRYMRYTRPTLNEVKRSNSLHTKWPPEIQGKEKRK